MDYKEMLMESTRRTIKDSLDGKMPFIDCEIETKNNWMERQTYHLTEIAEEEAIKNNLTKEEILEDILNWAKETGQF